MKKRRHLKKYPARWGERAGRGYILRGALGETWLVCNRQILRGEDANLLEFLVGEEPFFNRASALDVAYAGFARNGAGREAEGEQGRAGRKCVFHLRSAVPRKSAA